MNNILKISLSLPFLIFFIFIQSCNDKQNQKKEIQLVIKLSPVAYNDSIIGFQENTIKKVLDFSKNFQMLDTIQREAALNNIISEIDSSLIVLNQLPPFYGNSRLRDAAINWMKFYRAAFDTQYREIIRIAKKSESEITDNDIIRMNDLLKKVADSELVIHKKFEEVQQEFYKQFNIKGSQNQLNTEIEKIEKNNNNPK